MIIDTKSLEPFVKMHKAKGKKIVLVGGCFDVLHQGHVKFLKKARSEGDILILLLESDENIKKLKGDNRPINTFEIRSKKLESLGFIDLIVELSDSPNDEYYYNLTKLIKPDIIALTKNDPLTQKKKDQAELVGGKIVVVMNRDEAYSSTNIINKK